MSVAACRNSIVERACGGRLSHGVLCTTVISLRCTCTTCSIHSVCSDTQSYSAACTSTQLPFKLEVVHGRTSLHATLCSQHAFCGDCCLSLHEQALHRGETDHLAECLITAAECAQHLAAADPIKQVQADGTLVPSNSRVTQLIPCCLETELHQCMSQRQPWQPRQQAAQQCCQSTSNPGASALHSGLHYTSAQHVRNGPPSITSTWQVSASAQRLPFQSKLFILEDRVSATQLVEWWQL